MKTLLGNRKKHPPAHQKIRNKYPSKLQGDFDPEVTISGWSIQENVEPLPLRDRMPNFPCRLPSLNFSPEPDQKYQPSAAPKPSASLHRVSKPSPSLVLHSPLQTTSKHYNNPLISPTIRRKDIQGLLMLHSTKIQREENQLHNFNKGGVANLIAGIDAEQVRIPLKPQSFNFQANQYLPTRRNSSHHTKLSKPLHTQRKSLLVFENEPDVGHLYSCTEETENIRVSFSECRRDCKPVRVGGAHADSQNILARIPTQRDRVCFSKFLKNLETESQQQMRNRQSKDRKVRLARIATSFTQQT